MYYARGPRGLETGLRGSINVESLERIGARNVAADRPAQSGIATVSMEQILGWDPEVIITIDAAFMETVRADSRWRGIRAVRPGRVYRAPLLPFPWIDFPPSVNRLIGLAWLGQLFYPGEFAEDRRETAREFYAKFYDRAHPTTAARLPPGRRDTGPTLSLQTLAIGARRFTVTAAVATGSLVALIAVAFAVGRFSVSFGDVLRVLWSLVGGAHDHVPTTIEIVVLRVRGPGILAAVTIGAAMAAAGTAYQGLAAIRWCRPTSSASRPVPRWAPSSGSIPP